MNKVAELLKGPPLNAKKATAIATARVPVARATLPGRSVHRCCGERAARALQHGAAQGTGRAAAAARAALPRGARLLAREKVRGQPPAPPEPLRLDGPVRARAPVEGRAPGAALPGADRARGPADTLTWTAALEAANADLDAAGVVKTAEDDGALAGRFVDLLRLVAFARADAISTRGAAAALPADARGRSTATGRLQDPLEVPRATSAPSSRGGRRRSSVRRASRTTRAPRRFCRRG